MLNYTDKINIRKIFKLPFHVGIRQQLMMLVLMVALCSLIILSVITGIYFTANYKSLRADRLYVAAQLKSSQIDQNLNYLYYQCYWLSERAEIENALISYRAGNTSSSNWEESLVILEKFLGSSDLFTNVQLYDSNYQGVLNITNNGSGNLIPSHVLTELFPLSDDIAVPSSLISAGILTDPVLNGSNYLMSMSLPVFASVSVLIPTSQIFGYITIAMSADGLKSVFNDTTALGKSDVSIISALYTNGTLTNYHYIFPPSGYSSSIINLSFPIPNGSFIQTAFTSSNGGSLKKTHLFAGQSVAAGYSKCSFKLVNWAAIITQPEDIFLSPSIKLTKIIIGVVIGIAVVMCLISFPLAVWAAKPIIRLQQATEIIAAGRGLKSYHGHTPSLSNDGSNSSSNHKRNSFGGSLGSLAHGKLTTEKLHLDTFNNDIPDGGSVNYSLNSMKTHSPSLSRKRSGSIQNRSQLLINARVPVYRRLFSDELSELTDTFNTMTDELDRHYALLEDRVRARTKQLEHAKIEAESANEAKTVFIANISHELRTPLNGILGMTAIAMAEKDMDKVQNSLKLIFRSGELLLHILTELLTFSKNVLKRTKLEERDFLLEDVALQIKSIFGKLAKDQHVKLSILIIPNRVRIMELWGDSNRIIQIVMNLVSNALKFTPIDGKVDVRFKLLGEYDEVKSKQENYKEVYIKSGTELNTTGNFQIHLEELGTKNNIGTEINDTSSLFSSSSSSYDDMIFTSQFKKPVSSRVDDAKSNEIKFDEKDQRTWVIAVEVEDTGPGIAESLQESVFKPFVQGDQTLSRQYGGTGLGLSICRQLASMMKGTMKLDSKVDHGSKFTFTLPLRQTGEVILDEDHAKFEDEFNPCSKFNRKVKFKMANKIITNEKIPNKSTERFMENETDGESVFKRKNSNSTDKTHLANISSTSAVSFRNQDSESTDDYSFDVNSKISNKNNKTVGTIRVDRPFLQSTGTATSSRNVLIPNTAGSRMSDRNEEHKKETKGDVSREASTKILVAEDNNVNQEVIKRMLKLEGYTNIDLACDGREAFEKVKEILDLAKHYDIIFMDVQMPKVDGLVSTKMIRNDLHYNYPIVALTDRKSVV
ncbi:related to Osmosensing histidine protein kinase SLN1 [Saccharomycodes ludwigii]|uniref:histidine kinase n=1 Tax=Saccharomycodes ludwigii TaxID=36035 RepID=A0A376BA20_9ASCO|nr:related to Osmosensing histidine protein kinase SLN1 [Saccharomycodes ludwigii]